MDYKNGKIYKIVCNTTGLQYIGSTCNPYLSTRLAGHRSDYKRYLQKKHNFISSFEVLKNENYEIILIENCPCETKDQLHARERFHIENNDCVNMIKNVGLMNALGYVEYKKQSNKQYRTANKEKIAEYKKQYRAMNKEKIAEYFKQYKLRNIQDIDD